MFYADEYAGYCALYAVMPPFSPISFRRARGSAAPDIPPDSRRHAAAFRHRLPPPSRFA
jgi:hypothetical protein